MKVTRVQLERMPIAQLRRWARKVRGYAFGSSIRKVDLVERVLEWEAGREQAAA